MPRFFALIVIITTGFTQAEPLVLKNKGEYPLAPHVSYFVTQNQGLEIQEVLNHSGKIQWIKNTKKDLNLGFGDGVYWQKAELSTTKQSSHDWALEFPYAQLDQVEAYLVKDGEILQYYLAGDKLPFKQRSIQHPHIVFALHLEENQNYTLYARIESSGAIQAAMTLWQWDKFNQQTLSHFLLQGLFFGFVMIMALYNLVVWTSERKSIYLNYVMYIITFAIFQSSLSGIGFQFLWPDYPWVNSYVTALSLYIAFAAFNYFIINFFEMYKTAPKLEKFIVYVFYIYMLMALLSIFLPYYLSIVTASTFAAFNILMIIAISVYMIKIKHPGAKNFTLAWSVFLMGAVMLTLNKFGLIPVSNFTEYTLQFGAGFEIMYLSFALAERMNLAKKEKLALAIEVNKEREKTFNAELENLRLEKETNQRLEKVVKDRTKELTRALDHLSIAHDKLQTISITDALTELHNRYYFNEHFKIEYKRACREHTELSLIMLDVDHFKKVNDTYGHPAGDVCLRRVAQCIKKFAARESDICCRYGGEEFIIILPSTPLLNAVDIANDIRKGIEKESVIWEKSTMNITASFGVSSAKPNISDKQHRQFLVNQVDQALYEAKGQGRNRVIMFEADVF